MRNLTKLRLVSLCAILAICTFAAAAQTQHDRIDARGQVMTDRFVNRLFILISGATPDVSLGNAFKTINGSPVTITNFLNGADTQEVDLLCGDANTTVQNNANIALTGGADFTCLANVGISFRYDASQTKWVQFGGTGTGGGGGNPAAPEGALQRKTGSNFGASNVTESSAGLKINEDTTHCGSNPYIDVRCFGVRAIPASGAPATPGITFNSVSGSPNITISSTSIFKNGDGVVLYGAGSGTIGAPAAPTVIPSVLAAQTGLLLDVPGPAGGVTQYCYQVVAITVMGATNVGPETCTSTGPASLGLQTNTITSCTLVLQVMNCLTSAPHGLVVGAHTVNKGSAVNTIQGQANGASVYNPFDGWFRVATVPDNTHYTAKLFSDTRNGSVASSTGGTLSYWNSIHITAPELANNYQYAVYGRVAGGTKTLIGLMWPQDATLQGRLTDLTYLAFDDLGSTVTTLPNKPFFLPTTVPTAPTNDMLAAIIQSGAGTTSLVLDRNAGNTINGQTILFDDAVTTLAAANYAMTAPNAGQLMIPEVGASANSIGYVFNSPITLPQGLAIYQKGFVRLNAPVTVNGVSWKGETSATSVLPAFANSVAPNIQFNTCSPCIYATHASFFENLVWSMLSGNGAVGFMQESGGIPASGAFRKVQMSTGVGSNTYSNMMMVFRGNGAGFEFSDNLLSGSQNGNLTATTPGIYFDQSSNFSLKNFNMSGIGMAIRPLPAGAWMVGDNVYSQGNYMPYFSVVAATGDPISVFSATFKNSSFDTTQLPLVANYAGHAVVIDLVNPNTLSSNDPLITGSSVPSDPFPKTTARLSGAIFGTPMSLGSSILNSSFGANDGVFGRVASMPIDIINRSQAIGPAFPVFTTTGAPAAPTSCTVSGGGSVPVGTFYYFYAPIYADGSEGTLSLYCTATTTGGNQTVTVNLSAIPGVTQYNFYRGTSQSSVGGLNCSPITGPSYVDILAVICGFSTPDKAAGGPAGMRGGLQWSQTNQIGLTSITSAATALRNIVLPDASGTLALAGAAVTLAQTQLTTNGDLLTVAGGVLARKAIGADGTFLGVSGGAHSYITSSGTGSVCMTISCPLTTPTVATTLTMNAAAELRFTTTGGYAGFKAPASVGTNLMWQLPPADAVGCWASNGSFIISIIACGGGGSGTPGGSPGNIQYNNTSFTGSPALNWDFTNNILQVGNTGGALGKIEVKGNTSGGAVIQAQAVAGTPALLLPNASGTFVVNASSPLVRDAVTGNLTAPTVTTSAAPLPNNQLAVGQSGQALATVGSLGTTTTVYHGNAAGIGAFNPIVDADFSGQLGFTHGGTGQATRQAAINALLDSTNDVTGDLFIFDGTNVTRLARGSNGACVTYTGVAPFIAPGSCASGAITGVGAVNALAIWSTTSSLTQSPNLTYVPAVGLSLTQGANGSDTFLMQRATDSSPTGTYFRGRNAANNADLFRIDTLGNFFGASFTGVSTAAGFLGIGQGTAQAIVANTAGFTGPTSITGYNISVPAAAGTGVWRLTNAANIMSSTIVAASGVGSCTPANNVVVALNDNAAPQCSTVAGPMFGTQAANSVFKGPNSGSPAFPTFAPLVSAEIPPINLNTNGSNGGVTAILGFINGGCNATSASACFNNIWPGSTLGDTAYGGSAGAGTRLPGNITTTKMYLSQTGNGSISAAPAWAQAAFPDISGVCTIAQGCSGQTTANAALNAFLPAQGGNAGKVLGTDGANPTWVVGGGGGSGTPAPNYGTAFTGQTSVTITGATHNLGTKNLLVACYDNSSPARAIGFQYTIDSSSFDVIVNFAVSQSGYCAVNGSGPNRYAATFGSTSSLVVTGATHKLATADITVTIWDSASGTRHIIQPASVSIDSTTFDVTIIFASSQAGRVVLE